MENQIKEPSTRIGDKHKSVRVKKYILDFYGMMMKMDERQVKNRAEELLKESLERLPANLVTADLINKKLLVEVELETRS